jgi:type VI secretion system protein ImpE
MEARAQRKTVMATPKQLLDEGKLQAAIEALTGEVKANPTDIQRRTFLFELLCFAGDYDRAERQLDVVGHQSASAEIGVQVYRDNLKAERARARLLSDGLQPHFLTEPPAYVDLLLEGINRLREQHVSEARAALDRAEEERPALTGRLNGRPFFDFRDYNDILGAVVELFIKDHYTWLPLEQVRRIEINAPRQLRDLLWASARVETADGIIGEVFLPTIYPGSSDHPNDQVKLGRMTDWTALSEELCLGSGLRLYLMGEEEKAILEVRAIEFDGPPREAGQLSS